MAVVSLALVAATALADPSADLPPGAIRRLGTTSWRLPSSCEDLVFAGGSLWVATASGLVTVDAAGRVVARDPDLVVLAASPDGEALAVGRVGGRVEIWDLGSGAIRRVRGTDRTIDVAWLPDGRLAVASAPSEPPGVNGADFAHYAPRAFLSMGWPSRRLVDPLEIPRCADPELGVIDGEALLGCRGGALVRVEGASLVHLEGGPVQALWTSASGEERVVTEIDATHRIERPGVKESGVGRITAAAFAAQRVALGGFRGIEVHGDPEWAVRVDDGWVRALVFTPDDRLLGCVGRRVAAWDARSGALLTPWSGHAARAVSVAVSSDGATAASGGAVGEVLVWDLASGAERARLTLPDGAKVTEVRLGEGVVEAFAAGVWHRWPTDWAAPLPDASAEGGGVRVTADDDGTLLVWPAP